MAKKKDEDIENNDDLNQDNQDDFNEADDNFGLPEVDPQPLDDSHDESEPEADNETESFADAEETETYAYSSDDSDEDNNSDSSEETQEYVPGSYTPPQEESSNVGKIIAIILVVVVAGLAIWYLGFYRPAQQAAEKALQEQIAAEKAQKEREDKRKADELAQQKAAEEEAARLAAEEAAKPKIGTVETISSRTGRFYVVVASAIDGDLAMDYAKKLNTKGVNVNLIPPFGKSKFHRVTVDNQDSWAAAENRATELKSEYGEDVWVIKY
ncbi:MAG: SPOR domain-containing protein [Fulvivirga sp.]|uniref:SPOR domain-containing protein n=1 Tax=Fulvivirga sp. TaxID=1931237 RepID=UPI0032EC21E4